MDSTPRGEEFGLKGMHDRPRIKEALNQTLRGVLLAANSGPPCREFTVAAHLRYNYIQHKRQDTAAQRMQHRVTPTEAHGLSLQSQHPPADGLDDPQRATN